MNVLIATDGSDGAIAAAHHARRLLAPDAVVTVLAVADGPQLAAAGPQSLTGGRVADVRAMEQTWSAQRAVAETAARDTAASLGLDATATTRVVAGDAGRVICEVAGEIAADVVVVGSRGLGLVRRALLGSVSTYVVQNAPCAVFVVREAET